MDVEEARGVEALIKACGPGRKPTPKRKLTDEERAEIRARNRKLGCEMQQTRLDLVAAVDERARAGAEVDRALVGALRAGLKSTELRAILGVSHATFWRRAKAAGWRS